MCLIPSKGQDQCQVKSGHQMKMLHECRAAHVLSDTWELQFNGGIYFLILPRKGRGQANLSQISFFFLQKHHVLASFVSGFQKRHLFSCTTIRNAKSFVFRSDVITFNWFLAITSQTRKYYFDILQGCCMRVACVLVVCRLTTHILFTYIYSFFLFLLTFIFGNSKF